MNRNQVMLTALLAGAVAIAGCTGGGITNQFKDADARTAGAVGGVHSETKEFNVPPGSSKLTVRAAWSVGGTALFELEDPDGDERQTSRPNGGSAVNDDSWFSTSSPMPGQWELHIDIQGGATYAFGAYVS